MINRNSVFQFKNGLMSKNRVVVPPMASQTADKDGFATDLTIC
jgi:2,4-dienoyl-CoA reductase-like NADH-dependent reductase (Old Yellow Enzyme family)